DLTLGDQEFVSLVGVSGCGKSTLLAVIAGLVEPTSGEVLVSGKPVTGPGRDRGVVFQHATLLPWLTAQKTVEFALRGEPLSATQRRERARENLVLVGLEGFEDVYPAQLSGGMQQRVALARSLSYHPEILLMDEPFGALDALTRRDMQELLTEIWEAHRLTVLFVTHDIEEAVYISDRVVTMTPRPGRIHVQAEVDLARPRRLEMQSYPHFSELSRHLLKSIRGLPAAKFPTTKVESSPPPSPAISASLAREHPSAAPAIDNAALRTFLHDLIRANSENPPGREAEAAHLVANRLAAAGLEVELQEVEPGRPNVIARLDGQSEETLLFNAHLDTVAIGDLGLWSVEPLGGEILDGKIYGRGTADMKAGLAAMVAALEAIAQSDRPRQRSLLLTAVIDEEVWFKGTHALLNAGTLKNCTRAYVGEPTSLMIASAIQGAAEFTAQVRGRTSHTGMAELGDNAILAMSPIIQALESYRASLKGLGSKLGFGVDPSLNLGVIEGGVGVTFVPDLCKIAFDRQVLPGENMAEVIEEIRQLFAQVCSTNDLDADLVCEQSFNPWQAEPDSAATRALERAHQQATGTPAQSMLFRGYCEVELLAQAGIAGSVYGPGDLAQAHRPNEYVPIDEVELAARVYAQLAADFIATS
ncbi:MAG: ArgE/DapE family deacylase, partial [Propionibacteriaceae bacterium]|nr:ArgE/DapE family deacylase [Propionibacteriaceae bacterium]